MISLFSFIKEIFTGQQKKFKHFPIGMPLKESTEKVNVFSVLSGKY